MTGWRSRQPCMTAEFLFGWGYRSFWGFLFMVLCCVKQFLLFSFAEIVDWTWLLDWICLNVASGSILPCESVVPASDLPSLSHPYVSVVPQLHPNPPNYSVWLLCMFWWRPHHWRPRSWNPHYLRPLSWRHHRWGCHQWRPHHLRCQCLIPCCCWPGCWWPRCRRNHHWRHQLWRPHH